MTKRKGKERFNCAHVRWEIKDILYERVMFLIEQLPSFEKRLETLNAKLDELSDTKELYKDWNPTQLNNVYLGTLRFYNESVELAKKILDMMIDEEREKREYRKQVEENKKDAKS